MPLDGIASGYEIACQALARAWEPVEHRSIWQWADEHIVLPSGTSPKVGQYSTNRVPMSREIMECLSPHHPSRKVVAMISSQLLKTQVGINFVCYNIAYDPQTQLVVYPTIELAEDWSTDKFTPIANASPVVAQAISKAKSRDGSNTILKKSYSGGSLKIAGANTPTSLASRGGARLWQDEVDRYPQSAGVEGDPLTIARRALIAYYDISKEFVSSTPTIESLSRINKDFKLSDQRRYNVPCPQCGELQVLKWDNFIWPPGRPDEAHFVCEHNGCIIEEHHKPFMLADEHMGGRAKWIAENQDSNVPGFHAWAAYASLGMGLSWPTLAAMWEEVKGDPEKEKAYINIYRAETFEDPTEKLNWEIIKARAETYKLRTIPAGCLILTAGVDVQGNRLEAQILGWGAGKVWVIDYIILPGDPTKQKVWDDLDKWLLTPIENAFGISMRIIQCVVDSNYLTDEVLAFVRPRQHRGIIAGHGAKQQGKQAINAAHQQDRRANGKVIKGGVKSWVIGADTIKHALFLWLQGDEKIQQPHERMVHFSDELPEEYFTQLCAEIFNPRSRRWEKQQARNEALDTFVYAIAAARHPAVGVQKMRDADWLRVREALEPDAIQPSLFQQPAAEPPKPQPAPQTPKPQATARSDWIQPRKDWLK